MIIMVLFKDETGEIGKMSYLQIKQNTQLTNTKFKGSL